MNKIKSILALFIILPFFLHGQDSRGQALLDSMQQNFAGTSDSVHIINLYRVMDLSKAEGDDKLYALSLLYLSPLLFNAQDYPAYEKIINLSLQIAKDTSAVSKEFYVSILNNSAFLETIKGNYMKSKMIYLDALALQKEVSQDTFVLATIYNNIAACYIQLGDYENAYQASLQQLECVKNPNSGYYQKYPLEQDFYISRAYYTIGDNLKNQNKYLEAKENYGKSIAYLLQYSGVFEEQKSRAFIDSYIYSAETSIKLALYDEATSYINKIVNLQKSNSYKKYYTPELKGLLHYSTSKYESAIKFYEDALQLGLKQRSNNKLFPTIARLRMHIGDCYKELDSLQIAISKYHSGLHFFDNELSSDLSQNPNIELVNPNSRCFEILHKKAKIALKLFKRDRNIETQKIAKNTYNTLLLLVDKMKASYLKDGSKFFITDLAQEVYDEYLDLLHEMYEAKNMAVLDEDILNLIEKNKASVMFSSIEKKYTFLSSNLPSELIEEEQTLRTGIAFYTKELKTLIANSGKSSQIKINEQKVFELSERYAILNNKLKTEYPDFYTLTQNKNYEFTVEKIQNKLESHQLFIEYYESDQYIYSFSISKNKTHFYRQKRSNELVNALEDYFTYISTLPSSTSIDFNTATRHSNKIYSSLISPLLNVHGKTDELLVVSDGNMSKIPLESLLIRNDKGTKHDYLIKSYDIAYFYSIRQIFTAESRDDSKDLTVLGLAPVFGGENSESRSCNTLNLKALPFAQEELDYISNNFEGSFLSAQYATTDTLINSMGDFSVIHLATHACLNSAEPMLSQIHLANGSLTNYDIMNLNVSPDLVVLSACNTAQGNYQEGEGLISLSRGFFEAGVKSLQSSLWEINDYSSSKIIQGMYDNLKKGERKSIALRNSKLDYIEDAAKLRSHPYFWAGMIQIGNDAPLVEKSSYLKIFIIGGLILIVCLLVLKLYRRNTVLKN